MLGTIFKRHRQFTYYYDVAYIYSSINRVHKKWMDRIHLTMIMRSEMRSPADRFSVNGPPFNREPLAKSCLYATPHRDRTTIFISWIRPPCVAYNAYTHRQTYWKAVDEWNKKKRKRDWLAEIWLFRFMVFFFFACALQ